MLRSWLCPVLAAERLWPLRPSARPFAKTGNPNGPGLASWPAFRPERESYLEFGDQIVAKQDLDRKHLDFMSEFCEELRAHATPAAPWHVTETDSGSRGVSANR